MSQASDDTKAYSSWNRTPGKPNSSSNYLNTKMSNISSSTDSGVGRTPNWNSDADSKFGMMDSNPWSNNIVIQSNEGCQKPPWDENSLDRANNLTFGFSSQWGVGEEGALFTSQNPPWGLPETSPDRYPSNVATTVDNCWNASSCQSNEDYMPRTASIWSSGTQKHLSDNEPNNCTTTSANVEHRALSLSQHVLSQDSDNRESSSLNVFKGCEPEETQTWAQAAGKGILTTAGSEDDDGVKKEIDEQYELIINRVDGWGSHTVDQRTPWIVDDLEDGMELPLNACVGEKMTSLTESNVWTNEPPNGVGVWESHYENIGEKTSRWNSVNVAVKPKSNWEPPQAAVVGGQWDERDCDSCVWTASTNVVPEPRVKSAWMDVGLTQASKQEQSNFVAPIGSGSRTCPQNFPIQRNSNALVPGMSGSISSDLSEPHSRQSFYQNQNMMTNNNRSNPNLKVRPAINPGFRKDDAQGPLFNNNMDIGRAINQSSANQSNMMAQRNDWTMPSDNFRLHNGDMDGGMMGSSGYMPQSVAPGVANSAMKQHVMQQMHMAMGGRLATDNQLLFEKQIIKDINQLQAKQQELVQRITGLRSIAGSQAIIQEMTRTLNEVRQQLHTQQATLKVIRSQVPNNLIGGISNNQNTLSRAMPPGQVPPQSGVVSDLSQHMPDLKLQKRAMDLWPQGNLPSPSNISPYMGMDKSPGMFYNAGGQMNGLMSQSYAYNKAQQPPFVAPHRQSGPMWPPRGMSGLGPAYANSDCHSSMPVPHDDTDSMSKMAYPSIGCPPESRNASANTTTTALSLSQTLSSGNGVSSAFTPRDISFASANISEFVPGQPWPGVSFSQRDDSNVTLGTGQRGLLSVTNDHLEKLAISSDAGAASRAINGTSVTYLFIRDLPSHINIEMLRNALTSHSFPGLIQMHPNLAARWVLLHFNSNEETMKAFKCLYNKVGTVELVPDHEINQRMQYTNGIVGPAVPCAGPVDMHPQQQQQSQSHYLH